MSGIARDEVMRIAALARLSMDDGEIDRMQRDLASVLSYVEALAGLDTTGVEPTAHVIPLATPMRADSPEPAMDPALAVANAPEASGSAFVVPKVIAGEEEG
ncbi:MAG: Asp-tRNA(Asn)/Glu-tRNA(Gln) amidotransferase subunit GatC [Deltaproteobacteria bacterium]|nr:MAG: Asp-tRNA(Asn)/Glu-tRNA(Gln) amidotransferase subunit GatC [Deltaproteobacteria bacterium]